MGLPEIVRCQSAHQFDQSLSFCLCLSVCVCLSVYLSVCLSLSASATHTICFIYFFEVIHVTAKYGKSISWSRNRDVCRHGNTYWVRSTGRWRTVSDTVRGEDEMCAGPVTIVEKINREGSAVKVALQCFCCCLWGNFISLIRLIC